MDRREEERRRRQEQERRERDQRRREEQDRARKQQAEQQRLRRQEQEKQRKLRQQLEHQQREKRRLAAAAARKAGASGEKGALTRFVFGAFKSITGRMGGTSGKDARSGKQTRSIFRVLSGTPQITPEQAATYEHTQKLAAARKEAAQEAARRRIEEYGLERDTDPASGGGDGPRS